MKQEISNKTYELIGRLLIEFNKLELFIAIFLILLKYLQRNAYIHSLPLNIEENEKERVILFFDSVRKNINVVKEINHKDIEALIEKCKELGIQTITAITNIEVNNYKTSV